MSSINGPETDPHTGISSLRRHKLFILFLALVLVIIGVGWWYLNGVRNAAESENLVVLQRQIGLDRLPGGYAPMPPTTTAHHLLRFSLRSNSAAKPFSIDITSGRVPFASTEAAFPCSTIGIEKVEAQHPAIEIRKMECTENPDRQSVRATASFHTDQRYFEVVGFGEVGSYDAQAMMAVITALSQHRETAVLPSSPTPSPMPLPALGGKTFSQSGLTITAKDVTVASCSDKTLRPIREQTSTSLTILNESGGDIEVDEIDQQGSRARYADIPPSQSVKIPTFATHPWVFSVGIGPFTSCLTAITARAAHGFMIFH